MLSAVLQPEIDTLQTQIAQLQAQIAAASERMKALGEVESLTDDAIQCLQTAVEKVLILAPGAINNLKSTVLSLFQGGGDSTDSDGNQPNSPTPSAPTSGDGSLPPRTELMSWLTCDVLHGQKSDLVDQVFHEMIHQRFTRCELTCLLEDCPAESLKGQAVEIACAHEDRSAQFVELVQLSSAIAYQRRHDGEIICVYAGGNNKQKLRNWADWLTRTHSVTHGYQLREGQRLGTKWEIKLTPMTLTQIEELATCDFSLDPRSCYPDAPLRQPEAAAKAPRVTQIENIGVGDRVRSMTVKHWEYTVLAVQEDGFLDCERIGVTPSIRMALHPAGVELVTKAVSEEEALASLQSPLEQQFSYSILDSSNLDQRWSVSRLTPARKQQFLGSVSCGTDTQRWSHSRQPKYGQNIPCFSSKKAAAAALAEAYDQDYSMPPLAIAAEFEPDF